MSDLGPFAVKPGLFQRFPHFLDLMVRQREGTSAYRLWGAATVNDAYGNLATSGVGGAGPTLLLSALKDRIALSAQAARAGVAQAAETRKGHTSFQLDPDDFVPNLNGDDLMSFYRVQEKRVSTGDWLTVAGPINNGLPILGPIIPIPTSRFGGMQTSELMLAGTAPSNTGCVYGQLPIIDETLQTPVPMHIAMPRPAARLQIINYGADSVGGAGKTLLVSLNRGSMIRVLSGETLNVGGFGHMAGLVTELFLAVEGDADGCEFALTAGIDSGIGA